MKNFFWLFALVILGNIFFTSYAKAAVVQAGCTCLGQDNKCFPTQYDLADPASKVMADDDCNKKCAGSGVIQAANCVTQNTVDTVVKTDEKGTNVSAVVLLKTAKNTLNRVGFSTGTNGAIQIIRKMINFFVGTAGMVAMMLYIWAGFLWMSAAGNSENVTKAGSILVWTTLGLVAMLSSYVILKFVLDKLTTG